MHEHLLTGCTPVPLAHYLKALGILRLVAEQKDPHACGRWRGEYFELRTSLSREELQRFFLEEYRPTPVLAPWNGGSGFYFQEMKLQEKDEKGKRKKTGVRSHPTAATKIVDALADSSADRYGPLRDAIVHIRTVLGELGMSQAPKEEAKQDFILTMRSSLPDEVVAWMDAVLVLGQDRLHMPALLGTGGNDGNMDFTSNFMQRLSDVADLSNGSPKTTAMAWLESSFVGTTMTGSAISVSAGQFVPGTSGGYNSSSGFKGPSSANPWDQILMIEGSLMFASSVSKRLETGNNDAPLYPFAVRQTGVGYASAAPLDEKVGKDAETRGEMWMPLWDGWTSLPELRMIFHEGRGQIRRRAVESGIDFIQAIAAFGVDRGISVFQRYAFQKRYGKNFLAVPLDLVPVRRNEQVDLLSDLEHAHDRLRQKCRPGAKPEAPGRIARACRQLDEAVFALAKGGDTDSVLGCLHAAGQVERAYATSQKWATEVFLAPIHGLRPDWLKAIRDVSPEFRLAASLAGLRMYLGKNETLHFRQHLEQVAVMGGKGRSWVKWLAPLRNDAVWHDGGLVDALNGILARRLMRAQQAGVKGWPDWSPRYAMLDDITAFIEGRIDERLFADLLWGLVLIDWEQVAEQQREARENRPDEGAERDEDDTTVLAAEWDEEAFRTVPSSFYSLLRLCFQRKANGEDPIPLVPGILHRAMADDGDGAARLAARRLRASGLAPLTSELSVVGDVARRTAASMLFPIAPRDMRLLAKYITEQESQIVNT
ncbi:MAG: type I-U CRISPR-associated protein Csx17 [Flavobacteriales bacterium]|nr:type I-U CRISPR-associated protein Csx17 [Flavobacteriales bacterium]